MFKEPEIIIDLYASPNENNHSYVKVQAGGGGGGGGGTNATGLLQ